MIADKTYLVKLADFWERKAEFDRKMLHPSDRTKADDYVEETAKILRRLASSDGGVKVRELAWQQSHASPWRDDWHTTGPFTYTIRCADENGWKWSSGYGYGWCSTPDAAKSAAQANYEARIKSALVEVPAVKGEPEPVVSERISQLAADLVVSGWTAGDHGIELAQRRAERKLLEFACDETERHMRSHTAPPADAGMREALEDVGSMFEQIRLILINHLDEPVRSAFWKAVEGREKCRAALTAPGATTKSDGGHGVDYDTNDPMGVERSWPTTDDIDDGVYTGDPRLVAGEAASPRTILSSDCVDPNIEQAIRADEREKCATYRNALLWVFDRLSVTGGMNANERRRTMREVGNVLTGKASPAATYQPNDWDDSAAIRSGGGQ